MTTYPALILLLAPIFIPASGLDEPPLKNKAVSLAVQEMRHACYFTFVTLINMVQDKIPGNNTTFLMPNDRMLSNVSVPENKVMEFISMHSIPSTLLFDDMIRLPSGTMIPTNRQGFTIRISNKGRKRFYLNDIQLSSPNICTAGSSFRCHGINGVMKAQNRSTPPPTCFHGSPPAAAAAAAPSPAPSNSSPPPPLPLVGPTIMGPAASPPQAELSVGSRNSDSTSLIFRGLLTTILSCMILLKFHI